MEMKFLLLCLTIIPLFSFAGSDHFSDLGYLFTRDTFLFNGVQKGTNQKQQVPFSAQSLTLKYEKNPKVIVDFLGIEGFDNLLITNKNYKVEFKIKHKGVIVSNEDQVLNFFAPSETSGQQTEVNGERVRTLVKVQKKEEEVSCQGSAFACGLKKMNTDCEGSKKVLMQIETYSEYLMIHLKQGSSEGVIKSNFQEVLEKKELKDLSACRI